MVWALAGRRQKRAFSSYQVRHHFARSERSSDRRRLLGNRFVEPGNKTSKVSLSDAQRMNRRDCPSCLSCLCSLYHPISFFSISILPKLEFLKWHGVDKTDKTDT